MITRLRLIRVNKGLKQADLVRITGIRAEAISGFETGRVVPKPEELAALARALDAPGDPRTLLMHVPDPLMQHVLATE